MSVVVHVTEKNKIFRPPGGLGSALGVSMYRRGLRIESTAKRLCAVDTGRLRASIRTTVPFRRGDVLVVAIGTNVKYAKYVEEGTRNRDGSRRMRARPYLKPALIREMQ